MRHPFSLACLLFLLFSSAAQADSINSTEEREALAQFFSVTPDRVQGECPQHSYSLKPGNGGGELEICLNRADKEKRCELTVSKLSPTQTIAFDFKLKEDQLPSSHWFSLLQVHSFPDAGEAWRCPPMAMNMENGLLRMEDRWDATPISITSGHNCTEPGSTIQARNVFSGVSPALGEWHAFKLGVTFSTLDAGRLEVDLDGRNLARLSGPNTFNDHRAPYLKFGIYKPTGWETPQENICVQYRSVKITE